MLNFHLFPFEFVPFGSKIIIYGAGEVGREYLEQVEITGWCEVLAAVDKNYEAVHLNIPAFPPQSIPELDFDYIVIALEKKASVQGIFAFLLSLGIPAAKIIQVCERKKQGIASRIDYTPERELSLKDNTLHIALYISGGLGDHIISLRFFMELIRLVPDAVFDLYGNPEFIQCAFYGYRNIRKISCWEHYGEDYSDCDAALEIFHYINIRKLLFYRVNRLCPPLASCMLRLMASYGDYTIDVPFQQYTDAIFIHRAHLTGLNRYTALSHGGIFPIADRKVQINLAPKAHADFLKLGLGKYITFNHGAHDVFSDGSRQTKLWPEMHWKVLIGKIKKTFPGLAVIQLGAATCPKINGGDFCLTGLDLELVKHVLSNALLHIDCEGGLVHLATQLDTKCAVLFGPTPLEYYSYPQNVNISSGTCENCMGVTFDWFTRCCRGLSEPECMYSLSPDRVFRAVAAELNGVPEKQKSFYGGCECPHIE